MKALKAIGDLIHGMGIGAFVVVIIAMVLIVLANVVVADESIAVRPATLGEQNRSLNYPLDPYLATEGVDAMDFVDGTLSWDEAMTLEAYLDCLDYNKEMAYKREYIIKKMERLPSVAYIYEDLLEILVEKDCDD